MRSQTKALMTEAAVATLRGDPDAVEKTESALAELRRISRHQDNARSVRMAAGLRPVKAGDLEGESPAC